METGNGKDACASGCRRVCSNRIVELLFRAAFVSCDLLRELDKLAQKNKSSSQNP